jgi:16S rRNA (cytidine1402-2'-O)-methyltransferase
MPLAVCATPIGNLDDVTLRVLAELRAADVVLCEDTRHTRTLLARHGIEATLLSYHEHNEASRTAELVPRLSAGERVALVSDAGMPGISDPGGRLVRAALDAGITVTVLPGPSAVETALVASGLVGDRYWYLGFLPRGASALAAVWKELAAWLEAAAPSREVAVCRELTKRFEEVIRGTAAEVAARFSDPPKGEITLVIGPAGARDDAEDVDAALAAVGELVQAGTPRRVAADVVSRLSGVARNRLYRGSL